MTRSEALMFSHKVWGLIVGYMRDNFKEGDPFDINDVEEEALRGTSFEGKFLNDCPCCEYSMRFTRLGCSGCPGVDLWGSNTVGVCVMPHSDSPYAELASIRVYDERALSLAKRIFSWFDFEYLKIRGRHMEKSSTEINQS